MRASPPPLGARPVAGGVEFALWSGHAEGVELCLFGPEGDERRVALQRGTRGVWSAHVPGIGVGQRYGYRVHGPYEPKLGHRFNPAKLLIDPYARVLTGPITVREEHFSHADGAGQAGRPRDERDSAIHTPKAVVVAALEAVDEGERPTTPLAESVIYELHVKGLTRRHPAVPAELRGTYAGLAHPAVIEHLLGLGVTAVELLPVQQQLTRRFLVERGLTDYWGYNTIAFLAPDPRFAATDDPRRELRDAIRMLHGAGLQVLLDVVYNHTGEGDEHGPTVSFRGIDNAAYYRLHRADHRRYRNESGTGNALDATRPAVVGLIVDSLRTFATEYGVDGFRFDLATVLGRTGHGFSPDAPVFRAIGADPLLSTRVLIAEPWDLGAHGYRLGQFPSGWSEWNGRFRDTIRGFWAGSETTAADLPLRMAGSPDLFGTAESGQRDSVNYVTAHDGFTLRDLVSYAEKHNEANGEGNEDGDGGGDSRNFGVEGETDAPAILAARDAQRRALLATLLLARGAAMLLAGDEIGRTQRGNNNAYAQDNEISWIDWRPDARYPSLVSFVSALVALRRGHPLLRRGSWGVAATSPLTLVQHAEVDDHGPDLALLVALNPRDEAVRLVLPEEGGVAWQLLLDTAAPAAPATGAPEYVAARSVVLLALPRG